MKTPCAIRREVRSDSYVICSFVGLFHDSVNIPTTTMTEKRPTKNKEPTIQSDI